VKRPARSRAIGCTFALLAGAAVATDGPLPIPEQFRAMLDDAARNGGTLYRLDAAGARATDEMAAHKYLKRDKRLRGWLTGNPEDGQITVSFVGEEGGVPAVLYRVRVPTEGKSALEKLSASAPLDETESAQWRARTAALGSLSARKDTCSDRYNTVVLRRDTDQRIVVYLLAATTRPGAIVAGGHFRYEYSPDGGTELAQRAFMRSCITIAPDPAKGMPVSLMLTHLLDPTPTEIHVFLSLLHDKRVAVGTEKHLWAVEGSTITLSAQRE
jgi:hypothetical protein